ncbi:MAG: HetP family heterocyst commitment protein [Cyanobacteria bacterium P01_E01_bin.6]
MTTHSSLKQDRKDRTMTEEQFTQVVEAILDGKYSWACLLILKFAGYNPLHYIPYRTYNRLMKDFQRRRQSKLPENLTDLKHKQQRQHPNRIKDLGYIESLECVNSTVKGGDRPLQSTFSAWDLKLLYRCR